VNFTNVPWMFTLLATDDVQAPLVAGALGARRRFSVVTTADHDAASAWRTIGAQETMRSLPAPILQLAVDPSSTEDASRLRDLARGPSESVLVLAPPRAAARIVRALRAAGFTGALIGGATLGRRAFSEEAGAAAEGVLFPLLFDADCPEAAGFVARYRERFGSEPDYLAAHAHDAARLLVAAVRSAGPNRALIRDALAVSPQTPGAAGAVTWDPTGRNTRPPALGIWHDGRARRVAQGAATTSPE
jgi:ABC-type branched-subunit amino acid transport system substrate-binding protein